MGSGAAGKLTVGSSSAQRANRQSLQRFQWPSGTRYRSLDQLEPDPLAHRFEAVFATCGNAWTNRCRPSAAARSRMSRNAAEPTAAALPRHEDAEAGLPDHPPVVLQLPVAGQPAPTASGPTVIAKRPPGLRSSR
jgi:hypothetical protein